jgi:hypothetical protein
MSAPTPQDYDQVALLLCRLIAAHWRRRTTIANPEPVLEGATAPASAPGAREQTR